MQKAVKSKMFRLGLRWKRERISSAQSHWNTDSSGVMLKNVLLQQLREIVTQGCSRVSSRIHSLSGQRDSILEKHWTGCRIVGRRVRVSPITLLLCENKEWGDKDKLTTVAVRELVSRLWFVSLVHASKCWYQFVLVVLYHCYIVFYTVSLA